MSTRKFWLAWISAVGLSVTALAQWNPSAGQWGKTDATDVRVMTFNVKDHVCSGANKAEGNYAWCAVARIVAAMKPDVLIMQETGDNNGDHATGSMDSVTDLQTTLELFMHGGTDPFLGGTVGAYVQKYDPAFDLPYAWASSSNDGYNRNVMLSRFPWGDLNGDGRSQLSDFPFINTDMYVEVAGQGGIRGCMVGELHLPTDVYAGDLVVMNAHLKADSTSHTERVQAAERIAYYIDYLLNGAGTGVPDPHSKISDIPAATTILAPDTPVVIGGDWNEDELNNGTKGPAEWITCAATVGGTDGTDRDRTDMTYDDARSPYDNSRVTESSSKLDYLAWQDSIATLRRAFLFKSSGMPVAWFPPEVMGFSPSPFSICSVASDHRPVMVDLVLPLATPPDTTPPSPDPMTFATPPAPTGTASLTMTATTATDVDSPPVQYFFNFVSGGAGGHDSGWQASTTYTESDLTPNTAYTYRVKARDSAGAPNETAYSTNATTTTLANIPAAPTLSNATTTTLDLDVNVNGNPAATAFAILCNATADPAWNGLYVDASGNASATAIWQTDAQWGTATIQGLAPATDYCFQVKARNGESVETAFSTQSCAATGSNVVLGDLNCDGSVNFKDINPFVACLTTGHCP